MIKKVYSIDFIFKMALLIFDIPIDDGGFVDEIYCEINTTPSKFDIT